MVIAKDFTYFFKLAFTIYAFLLSISCFMLQAIDKEIMRQCAEYTAITLIGITVYLDINRDLSWMLLIILILHYSKKD